MSEMSNVGFHCLAPDWIGFGFSDKPQPGYGFNYTEKEFHEELDRLLDVLGVKSPFFLVVQGFLVGSFGLTWALKNPSRISKLAILNSPLTASSPVPGLFQQLRIPLFGEFTCQNAVMAERFIEAGSTYVLKVEKADVYRLPYLSSGGPGFALLEAARKANFKETATQIASGFSSGSWDKPILLAWGVSDKYLPQSVAEEFQKGNPSLIKLKLIEGAGHMPQEDWPEKVVEALRMFLL
ncbi:cis-3-alkyl-4-alkyloxetan-2-one decarboxylase isoform X3 [Rhodamnia argentea]|nr:cis-3-alkyl-4-alkyloxetan-2-one decarboxylase isoform X3 [Rhodamnia argentea]